MLMIKVKNYNIVVILLTIAILLQRFVFFTTEILYLNEHGLHFLYSNFL